MLMAVSETSGEKILYARMVVVISDCGGRWRDWPNKARRGTFASKVVKVNSLSTEAANMRHLNAVNL